MGKGNRGNGNDTRLNGAYIVKGLLEKWEESVYNEFVH